MQTHCACKLHSQYRLNSKLKILTPASMSSDLPQSIMKTITDAGTQSRQQAKPSGE